MSPQPASVTIRPARETDRTALGELAALDSGRMPSPPVLVAELSGEIVAAVGIGSGERVANPFVPTAAVLELLCMRARRLADADDGRPWRRTRRHRTPSPARTA